MSVCTVTQTGISDSAPAAEELRNSLTRLLRFADLSTEEIMSFVMQLESFKQLKDKSFTDPDSRILRELITASFFKLYSAVFTKCLAQPNPGLLFRMFLNYGFVDDSLLTPEQSAELYAIADSALTGESFEIYSAYGWLKRIAAQEKDPSLNENGLDYFDVFREKKKKGEVTDHERIAYEQDISARLAHEINGMMRLGQRMCHGQMSGYFPILNKESFYRQPGQSLLTPDKLETAINSILNVDYSVFHRETVCNRLDKGIKNELVWKSVHPEFILIPIFGVRGVMWQELTGRVKTSPARFLFPVFIGANIDEMLLDVIARFRWELDKSMSGSFSRETTPGSLTADYTSYIQFYRKNRDLSGDARDKIKAQIDKYRGNVAEIFMSDYRTWIQYESKGVTRLNKTAREILFKYCPFSAPIREKLSRHPMYSPMIAAYDAGRIKKVKELEARYARMKKPNIPLDENLSATLAYYKM